jgi:C4-dicarboxylate transporter, DctM subunit
MRIGGIWASLARTARTCSMIFAIIIGAMIFGYFATSTQITQSIIKLITHANLSPNLVLLFSLFLFLLLGCMLDQIAILLITVPLIFPLIIKLGFNPIWFGVVLVKTAEIGMVTPPIGMNIFVTSAASGVRLEEIYRGIWPFVVADMVVLLLLCIFPKICLWLPNLMSN